MCFNLIIFLMFCANKLPQLFLKKWKRNYDVEYEFFTLDKICAFLLQMNFSIG